MIVKGVMLMFDEIELHEYEPTTLQHMKDLFYKQYITTKPRLLDRIKEVIQEFRVKAGDKGTSNEECACLEAKADHLERFRREIVDTPLPSKLEDWWSYSFSVGSQGSVLYLNHHSDAEIKTVGEGERLVLHDHDAEFPLVTIRARFLTAEQYAEKHHAASATVRVWIRRGKIRSAMKTEKGWMIPELASPITRGYSVASYRWEVPLEGMPKGFEWLHEPGGVIIGQRKDNRQLYEVDHYEATEDPVIRQLQLTGPDVEKLEAFLIANPQVEFTSDTEFFD